MKMDNTLLERFFRNQCTEEEALEVVKYLETHPQKLDELFPEQLWQDMEALSVMPADKKETLLQAILKQAAIKQSSTTLVRVLSVAASLLLILGLGWWLGRGTGQPVQLQNKPATAYT